MELSYICMNCSKDSLGGISLGWRSKSNFFSRCNLFFGWNFLKLILGGIVFWMELIRIFLRYCLFVLRWMLIFTLFRREEKSTRKERRFSVSEEEKSGMAKKEKEEEKVRAASAHVFVLFRAACYFFF